MRKFKLRPLVYHALFIIVVMVVAMASAVLEASAVLGSWPDFQAVARARSAPQAADRPAGAVSSVDGALVSVAAQPARR